MEVVTLRPDESEGSVLHSLLEDADLVIPVDCADPKVSFYVKGFFVFPKGSLVKPLGIDHAT